MAERLKPDSEKARNNFRRYMGGYLAMLCLTLMNGDSVQSTEEYFTLPGVEYSQPELNVGGLPVEAEDLPSQQQLSELLSALSRDDRSSSRESVDKALRLIEAPVGTCSALQIDENGTYLTARHCLFLTYKDEFEWNTNVGDIQVKDPYTGDVHQAISFIAHPSADIGLLFAPTGEDPNPVEGIRLTNQTFDDERLHLNGFIPPNGTVDSPTLFNAEGVVDDNHEANEFNEHIRWKIKYKTELWFQEFVMGIKPYGGTSGSPILNDRSEIVGILSGVVFTGNDFTNERSNYDGARIVSTSAIYDLPEVEAIILPTI